MFLFFDTETARVNNAPRIIQMGWVLVDDNGVEFRSQCFIVCPDDFEIPVSFARSHRITTEVARRNGMKIGAVLDALAKDAAAADVLVAHNAHFDKSVVRDELFRAKRDDVFAGKDLYCTMRSSIHFCKINTRRGYKWPTLEQLHISFLIPPSIMRTMLFRMPAPVQGVSLSLNKEALCLIRKVLMTTWVRAK